MSEVIKGAEGGIPAACWAKPCVHAPLESWGKLEAQVLVQEHNGDCLLLIQHEQIRWEIIKPEGLTCMIMGHPIPAN